MLTLTLGLLSDTHMPHRMKQLPAAALDALAGVNLILHAGDVDDPTALDPLQKIAPVHAVRGNFHLQDFSDGGAALPAVVELRLAGHRVVLTHGHRPGLFGFWLKGLHVGALWLGLTDNGLLNRRAVRRLARLYPEADLIIFGHSHRAHVEWVGGTLLVNPGAVCPTRGEQPTVARVRLGAGEPQVEIVPLQPDGIPTGGNAFSLPGRFN
jgi:putative phosphoesterase